MASRPEIRPQMQVLTSDRAFLGTVERVEAEGIRVNLTRAGEGHQVIPNNWIERVDEHVHLNRAGAEVEVGLKAAQFNQPAKAAAPAATAKSATNNKTLLWVIIAVVVIAGLLLIVL